MQIYSDNESSDCLSKQSRMALHLQLNEFRVEFIASNLGVELVHSFQVK